MIVIPIESDIRKQVAKITSIRSKGTDDEAYYNLPEEAKVEARSKAGVKADDGEGKVKEEEKESVDDNDDEVGCYTVNGIRSGFWSIRENRGRLIKAGLTRREKEGVHLGKGESNDCDDVGLTISEIATIKDSVFKEEEEAVHHKQHKSRSNTTSQQPKQPRVACYCHVLCKDQQPVYPLTGSGVPGCHHRFSSVSSSTLKRQLINCNQFNFHLYHKQQSTVNQQLSNVNLNTCDCTGGQFQQTPKRYSDHRLNLHTSASFSSSHLNTSFPSSVESKSSFSSPFVVKSDCIKGEARNVNKLTVNQLVKCSPVGSNNDSSFLFSGIVANKRKVFTRQLVKNTIKSADRHHNINFKLKQQPTTQLPSSSTTQSSPSLSRSNPVEDNNREKHKNKYQRHHQQHSQCYKSSKMVAETDNHSINSEGMEMTINHSNREMAMFLDNINGHHYENINVHHPYSHNPNHHLPLAIGKTLNTVSYLHKDRPSSANSYSLESNSSGSNTTESSGAIPSPSGSNDDTHGDELQYGPGIVDKLRSKFLQYSLQTSRNNGYRSVVKRCSSLENLADRDSPSSSPLYHTCKGSNFGIRKGPTYVKYHQQQNINNNNHNSHHCSKQSNHTKGNNQYGVVNDVDINCSGGAAAVVISNNNRGLINGKLFQSVTSTASTEKLLHGEYRNNGCLTASRTPNGFTSSSSSSSVRSYRKYEQQPIKGNHYHHLNQHSSIYHNHNHRYNCDGLLKRAQSVETLLLESRNCKSAPSTSSSATFTNSNANNTVNNNNSNLNSTFLTSTAASTVNTTISSTSTSNSGSDNCEPLLSPLSNQQSRWQSTNNNNNNINNNISLAASVNSSNNVFSSKVNSVSQVCNHLVTKQQDFVDTVTNNCKKMSSDDDNIADVLPSSECKAKSASIYSPLSAISASDKKMNGDVTAPGLTNNHIASATINNTNNNNGLVNHGPRKLVQDELPKPDTVKNYKKIFETNSVSPTPLTGPMSPSSATLTPTSTATTAISPGKLNDSSNSSSPNDKDSDNRNGQAYRKGGIYGSSNSAIRRKPPVLSSIEKKITNTVNKVTVNSNNNSNNNRLINGSTTSSSPTSPALPPKPPFLITKKSPLNGELNHVNVNNNYLSAIKPMGKQQQLVSSETNKNKINNGKSINGSKDRITGNAAGSSHNLVRSKPLPSSPQKPKLINNKSDEQPSSPTSRSSSLSSSPLLSPSSFIPPSPLSGVSKKSIEDNSASDTVDCPIISSSTEYQINGHFSPSLDNNKEDCKEVDKTVMNGGKMITDQKATSSTTVSTTSTTTSTSSMLTNKPIANIKPIQLESHEDRWKPLKKSTLPQESSESAANKHEKSFPSMGVTTTNIIKDQSNHNINYNQSELPSRVTCNDKNKINSDNQVTSKRINEVDEKPKEAAFNSNNKDNLSNGSSTKLPRSYSSTTSPPIASSVTTKSPATAGTTMIFDFRGKNVKANVAVHSPPFSVVRPPTTKSDDNEDDFNYTGSTEVPQPSGIIFKGENVVIDGGSLLVKRNKKLTLTFNDKATSTFEYPSEASFIDEPLSFSSISSTSSNSSIKSESTSSTSSDESSVIQQQSNGSSLKNNTTLGSSFSGGLASYKPTFLSGESASFQLGVSRVIKEENDKICKSTDEDEESGKFNMLKPAEPSETSSWSTSSTALDLLF
ncbi:probable serine/threonine-protein kinase DDB_G0282963 [Tetranychus urticae]|uniref:probable serine/threonine-protein kinase DDB_G0282963 n=1 Tax=Tetranychus urticae TaxID=32264 RepID=UPI00077BAAB1|nr:probable serine/threonine-protein kinase DDB_G0282963 [Tetranychus urticae]